MLPDFTPAVGRALEVAQHFARRAGSGAVQPEHLLQGFLEEEEGRATVLLTRTGLDTAAVHSLFLGRDAALPPNSSESPLPLDPAMQDILLQARRLAREHSSDRTPSSDQVILALLRGDEPLRRQLETLGLSLARLEAEVLSAQA